MILTEFGIYNQDNLVELP